jgi:hypothetical protein
VGADAIHLHVQAWDKNWQRADPDVVIRQGRLEPSSR